MLHVSRKFDLEILGRDLSPFPLRAFSNTADVEADVDMLDLRLTGEALI